MVAIAERQEVKNFSTISISTQSFYEESEDELLRDWKLIQEAENNYDESKCMSAKKAYLKGLEYINNLK